MKIFLEVHDRPSVVDRAGCRFLGAFSAFVFLGMDDMCYYAGDPILVSSDD